MPVHFAPDRGGDVADRAGLGCELGWTTIRIRATFGTGEVRVDEARLEGRFDARDQ